MRNSSDARGPVIEKHGQVDELCINENRRDYESDELVATYHETRPHYPDEVRLEVLKCLQINAGQGVSQKFMLDVGCGGGISTKLFADDFERILGIDISESQIEYAKRSNTNSNVTFQIVHDNLLPVEDGSTDLVFCGVSFHYLNIPVFLAECDRVLVPGGLLVCVTYIPDAIKSLDGRVLCGASSLLTKQSKLEYLKQEFAYNAGMDRDVMKIYFSHYRDVFDSIRNPTKRHFEIAEVDSKVTISQFVNRQSTCEGYITKNYPDPKQDPLNKFREGLCMILQDAGIKCEDTTEFIESIRFRAMFIAKTKDFALVQ